MTLSPPSSRGVLLTSSVTLTDAQIKALPTTEPTIIAAPAAGYAIDLLRVHLLARILAAGREYTNINAGVGAAGPFITFKYDGGPQIGPYLFNDTYLGNDLIGELLGSSSDVGIGGNTVFAGPWYDVGVADMGTQPVVEVRGADINAKALLIDVANAGSGNFTGGHASNTLIVRSTYTLVELA